MEDQKTERRRPVKTLISAAIGASFLVVFTLLLILQWFMEGPVLFDPHGTKTSTQASKPEGGMLFDNIKEESSLESMFKTMLNELKTDLISSMKDELKKNSLSSDLKQNRLKNELHDDEPANKLKNRLKGGTDLEE